MGKAWSKMFTRNEMRILIVGLDAAGKTTVLYKLELGEVVTTIPKIGFNVETVEYKDVSFTCWDVGGKDKIRPIGGIIIRIVQASFSSSTATIVAGLTTPASSW